MNLWHRVALTYGLLPLIVGIAVFSVWLLTRWDWLMFAGLYTIGIGLILFVGGLISLLIASRRARQQGIPYKQKNLLILGVLLINFPVALAMMFYAHHLMTIYDVLIINELGTPLNQIILTDPAGEHYAINDVAAHSQTHHEFHFGGEGSVSYEIKSAPIEQSGVLVGYITSGLGGQVTMRIDYEGKVTASESFD